jgi:hypothetical protein
MHILNYLPKLWYKENKSFYAVLFSFSSQFYIYFRWSINECEIDVSLQYLHTTAGWKGFHNHIFTLLLSLSYYHTKQGGNSVYCRGDGMLKVTFYLLHRSSMISISMGQVIHGPVQLITCSNLSIWVLTWIAHTTLYNTDCDLHSSLGTVTIVKSPRKVDSGSNSIQEVLGSNSGQDTKNSVWGLLWFSSVPPGKCQSSSFN